MNSPILLQRRLHVSVLLSNLFLADIYYIALTSAAVRLRLAEEEDARRADDPAILHQEITPAILIIKGLELEDNQ